MAEIYVTVKEAAMLEDVTYNCLQLRLSKNSDNYIVKIEKCEDGWRDRTMVALSSLSKKARRAYRLQNQVEAEADADAAPWYTEVDLAWYISQDEERYYNAIDMVADIQAFLSYNEAERTSFATEFAASMNISARTLYRYAESYAEAEHWAAKLSAEDGQNYDYFKVLSLCRKPRKAGKFPSLPPEQRAFIENVWFDKDFAANRGTIDMLYSLYERQFKEAGAEYASYQTVARYISHCMDERRMKGAHDLAKDGLREWKRNNQIKGLRDTSRVPVLGIVQGDSHTFDFWVEYTDPSNGKVSAIRPTMVAWIDTRSRVVMGCVWGKTINSQSIKQSMIKLVYEYGVPYCIHIDNGKDYTSREMLGRNRKQRGDGLLQLDKEATGFYRSLGIKDDYRALPYQPWDKGPVERFFGTVCKKFSKWLASYTGTLTGSRTSDKIKKDIDKLLAQGKLLTMEEAYRLWDMWLNDVYHKREHKGLKLMHENWTQPVMLFENAPDRIQIPPPPLELAETLLMKPGKARVYQTGINRFGQRYMNYELTRYIGETLPIRYNPDDMSKLYVYNKDNKKICEATSQELLGYEGYISERQLIDHWKLQKKQLADDRQMLKEATTPFELRGVPELKTITGGLDIMLENKKRRAIECHCEVKQEPADAKKAPYENSYFQEKANEAMRKLRKIGG